MADVNARQAMVPEGATVLENSRGTAPGLWLEADGRAVILLPGPPHGNANDVCATSGRALVKRSGGMRQITRELRVAGMPESDVDQRISPIYTGYDGVRRRSWQLPAKFKFICAHGPTDRPRGGKILDELAIAFRLRLVKMSLQRKGNRSNK